MEMQLRRAHAIMVFRHPSGNRPVISSPYVSFSIGAPVITVSAPLRGTVRGVIAADLKLDNFSDFVSAQRPGAHGTAVIFDSAGTFLAHPDFAQFVATAQTHPSHPQLPNVREIKDGLVAAALMGWDSQTIIMEKLG